MQICCSYFVSFCCTKPQPWVYLIFCLESPSSESAKLRVVLRTPSPQAGPNSHIVLSLKLLISVTLLILMFFCLKREKVWLIKANGIKEDNIRQVLLEHNIGLYIYTCICEYTCLLLPAPIQPFTWMTDPFGENCTNYHFRPNFSLSEHFWMMETEWGRVCQLTINGN